MKFILTFSLIFCGIVSAQKKEQVPNVGTRASQGFARFPDWQDLVFVNDNTIKQEIAGYVNQHLNLQEFNHLSLNNFDYDPKSVNASGKKVSMGFAADVRFIERGKNNIVQGTLLTQGRIVVDFLNKNIVSMDVLVDRYDDSNFAEGLARNLKITSSYNAEFVNKIVKNALKAYLSEPKPAANLAEVFVKSGLKISD